MTRGGLASGVGVSLLLATGACRAREPELRLPDEPRRIAFEMKSREKTVDGCIAGASGCSYIRLDYPVIVEAPTIADVEAITATIRAFLARPLREGEEPRAISEMMDGFIQEYRDFRAREPSNDQAWFLERKAFVLHQRLIVLSLSFVERSYLGSGRRSDTVRFVNLDPRTGATLALSDVVRPEKMPALATIVEARFGEDERFGASGVELALTENFSLGEKGLTFYYNAGDVVPEELGPAEILLTYGEVEDLLAPEYRPGPET